MASSRISSREDEETARAIATSCRSSTLSSPTARRSSTRTWRLSSTARASARSLTQSMRRRRPRGSRPMKMFSATLSVGASSGSWLTITMPRSSASFGDPIVRSSPSISMRPASGASAPDAIRASVDLPEPFSPVSACTTPASSARSTPSRATTPGNRFVIPVSRSSGVKEGPRLVAGARIPRRARRCGPRRLRRRQRRARSREARRSSCSKVRRSPGR